MWLFVLNFFVFLSAINSQNQNSPRVTCPLPNQHCDCTNFGDVVCLNINFIPDQLPNTTVFLELENNFIGPVVIKEHVERLQDLALERLYISNNNFEIIEDFAFETLYRLLELDISDNRIQVFTENTFKGLKSLTDLYANDAGVETLSSRAFEPILSLKYIDLEDNSITTIGLEFSILSNLETLLLADNQITSISRGAFSGLNGLKHLSLFGNQLSRPMSSWFRDIVQNNGNLELDRRSNSLIADPNPWLCCPDMSQYHNFVIESLDRNLSSFSQLNIACFWPVQVNGRLISSLTTAELAAMPCSDFTTSTKSTVFTTTSTTTTTTTAPSVSSSMIEKPNFLSDLSNVGAVFILLTVALLGGSLMGGLCCCYQTKKGKQKFHAITNIFRPRCSKSHEQQNDKNSTELSRRPYRQQSFPMTPHSNGNSETVQKSTKMGHSNYTMQTDESEEEKVWSKEQ